MSEEEPILGLMWLDRVVWVYSVYENLCQNETGGFWMKEGSYFGWRLSAEDEAVVNKVVIKVGKSWSGIKFKGRYRKMGGDWVTFLTDYELTFEDDDCCFGEEKKVTLPGPGSNVKFRGKFVIEYTLTDLGNPPSGYDALPVPLVFTDSPVCVMYGTVKTDEGGKGRLRHDYEVCSVGGERCAIDRKAGTEWLYECKYETDLVTGYKTPRWYLKEKTCPPTIYTTLTCHEAVTEKGAPAVLTATLKDDSGNPLAGMGVGYTLYKPVETSGSATSDSDGFLAWIVPAESIIEAGKFIWAAWFGGSGPYLSSGCSNFLTVEESTKTRTTLTCHDATTEEGSSVELSATLKDENGNPLEGETVTFTLRGETYSGITDSDGDVTVTIPAADVPPAGEYKWIAKYEGNEDYKQCPCIGTLTVTAPKTRTTLTCHDATTEEGSSVELSATLKDENGDPLEGETVTFTLQGKTYSDTTDSNGDAAVTVPATDVPPAGQYTWTAEYEGNDYGPSSCAGTLTVTAPTKPRTTLTCHDATTEEGLSVVLSATLKDEDGNPLEGETVTFTLQGKTYSDTTDSNGDAAVTVPATDVPPAGQYTWTAEYEGNDYEASSCTGTLTVTTAPPCTEGDTKCIGYNLYECRAGRWELKEVNSPECGYTPPIPCPIACVCAGTELVDCLGPIREFRDKTLKSTRPGRKFVDIYYNRLTPLLSPVLMKSAALRKIGQQVIKLLLLLLNDDRRGKGDHQG